MTRRARAALAAALAGALVTVAPSRGAAPPAPTTARGEEDREQRFVESLRAEDPEAATRYTELRAARRRAMADYEEAQRRYRAAGPELRVVFLRQLRDAERRYAEGSIAILDFLDGLDRRAIERYREAITRIEAAREERARTRGQLEQRLRGE